MRSPKSSSARTNINLNFPSNCSWTLSCLNWKNCSYAWKILNNWLSENCWSGWELGIHFVYKTNQNLNVSCNLIKGAFYLFTRQNQNHLIQIKKFKRNKKSKLLLGKLKKKVICNYQSYLKKNEWKSENNGPMTLSSSINS